MARGSAAHTLHYAPSNELLAYFCGTDRRILEKITVAIGKCREKSRKFARVGRSAPEQQCRIDFSSNLQFLTK